MKLLRSTAFVRSARRLVRRNPSAADALKATLGLLQQDPFDPRLRTHKLKGKLSGSWAATAGYDLRVVFEFVDDDGERAILLESVGTHEEVY